MVYNELNKGTKGVPEKPRRATMESIKNIITVGQTVIAHKSSCTGIIIYESNKKFTVTKVNKKSFIAGGIKFTLNKIITCDAYGHPRKDGKQVAFFTTPGRLDGTVSIEF